MRVWDAPTRLFHWVLVLLIGTSWLTQYENWMGWHKLSGYTILTLLLFRLAWGFVGSETSRFTRFLKSPTVALHHLARINRREADVEIGHNAAGGWMVLLMLLLLLVQAITGLFSNDDIATEGPLRNLISKPQSDWFSHIHSVNFVLIEIAIVLHVLAISAYAVLKKQNLVRPMVTGKKRLPGAMRAPRMASPILAVLLLILAAGAVAALVRYG
jgi:cytochrome b